MRVPPLLDPRVCPGSNCSSSATSTPRRANHQAVDEPIAPAPITTTSTLCALMQARRYVVPNSRNVSRRTLDDLPPIASDDELLQWSQQLCARPSRPNRPLVATRINSAL